MAANCLEVPVAVPSAERTPIWYYDAVNRTWESESARADNQRITEENAAALSDEEYQGLASITSLSNEITLTSSALPDDPNSFVLTKLVTGRAPRVVRYALPRSSATDDTANPDMSPVLRTALHVLDIGTVARVVLVEATGLVHHWQVQVSDLTPVTAVVTLDMGAALDTTNSGDVKMNTNSANGTSTAGNIFSMATWLRRSALTFLSERLILVAWTPWLLAFDILDATASAWSSSLTLENMSNRKSSVKSLLYGSLNYLAGRSGDAGLLQDMTAILALASSTTPSGHAVAYSWHDGGVLRQWIHGVNGGSNKEPTHVYEYHLADALGPALEGARLLAAPVEVDGKWALAVYGTTPPSLFLVEGRLQNYQKYQEPLAPIVRPLSIPMGGLLVTWQWTGVLQTLWQTNMSGSAADNWTQWTYDASAETSEPVYKDESLFWNALSEEKHLAQLDFTADVTSSTDLSNALHSVDQRFLQFLLRPSRVRGTGTTLPPATRIIQQALTDLSGKAFGDSTSSISVKVVLGMHEWRNKLQEERRERQSASYTTPHRSFTSSLSPNNSAAIPPATAHKTPRAIYESLRYTTSVAAAATAASIASPGSPTVVIPPHSIQMVAQQVQEYQECWKKFLVRIWELERARRSIFEVSWLPLAATGQADQAVVVRGESISVVARAGQRATRDGPQAVLDNAAIRVLAAIADNEAHETTLMKAEGALWLALYSGRFALSPQEVLEDFKERITPVGETVLWERGVLDDSNGFIESLENPDVPLEDHIRELERLPFGYGLEGLNLLPLGYHGDSSMQLLQMHRHGDAELENIHWRVSSVALGVQCLDSMRRLMLGRYIVLKNVGALETLSSVALWGYLHCVSLLLTSAQHVPLPLTATNTRNFPVLGGDEKSPPKKRPSVDNNLVSLVDAILNVKEKTMVMDAFQIDVARGAVGGDSPVSLLQWPVLVIKAMFHKLFEHQEQMINNSGLLPELTVLGTRALDHPRFALWLSAPALQVKSDVSEQRRAVVAQCLLRLAENKFYIGVAEAYANRAFHLLRFNHHEIEQGVNRVIKLHQYLGDGSRFVNKLLALVEQAVDECTNAYTEDIWKQKHFGKLLDLYFSAAIQARQWKSAAVAATMHVSPKIRSDNLKRLARYMVDSGALADLKVRCSVKEDDLAEERLEGVDLYAISMEHFAGFTPRDVYLYLVNAKEPVSDYQCALFVLHVANYEWKRAAQAMDLRYVNALSALLKGSDSLTEDDISEKRERLAVEDLALSATACAFAMDQVDDKTTAYLVSGEINTNYATVPLQVSNEAKHSRLKRPRELSSDKTEETDDGENHPRNYMRDVDLRLRAARAKCFQMLHIAGKAGIEEAKRFLHSKNVSRQSDQYLISEMFNNGYYQYGLMLAKALRDTLAGMYMGLDIVHDAASHLACNFLIPLMLGKETFPKPSIQQMHANLDAIAPGTCPLVPPTARSLKAADSTDYKIRQLAGEILRHLTVAYTTSMTPLAKDVVQSLLFVYGPAPLPEWLHSLMVHGSPDCASSPGIFAKRAPESKSFLGDPSFLLTKYTTSGMFELACRTVMETLAVDEKNKMAAKRLPEKGNIDWVPYRKIDVLQNLIDVTIRKKRFTEDREKRIKASRNEMADTLDRHFELLKISEMGLQSARVLP